MKLFFAAAGAVSVLSLAALILLSREESAAQLSPPGPPVLNIDFGPNVDTNALAPVLQRYSQDKGVRIELSSSRGSETFAHADIVCTTHDKLAQGVEWGQLRPVQPRQTIKASQIESFVWDAVTLDDLLYAYPIALDTMALVYNTQLLSHAPGSLDELPALHRQMSGQGIQAIAWDYEDAYLSWPILAATDHPAIFQVKPDRTYDLRHNGAASPGVRAGALWIKRLVDQGILPRSSDASAAIQSFRQGKTAMLIVGRDTWRELKKLPFPWAIAPIPGAGEHRSRALTSVWGCAITGQADMAKATDFIENHLLSPVAQQALFADSLGLVPTQRALFEELQQQENKRQLWDLILGSRLVPGASADATFWSELSEALKRINKGEDPALVLQLASKNIGRHGQ